MPSNPNSRMGKDVGGAGGLEFYFLNALQWFCSKFFCFVNLEITKGRLGLTLGWVWIPLLGAVTDFVFSGAFLEKSLARNMQELVGSIQDTSLVDGQL